MKTRKTFDVEKARAQVTKTPETEMALRFYDFAVTAERLVALLKEFDLPPELTNALAQFEFMFIEAQISVALPLFERAESAEHAEKLRLAAEEIRAQKAIFEWEHLI